MAPDDTPVAPSSPVSGGRKANADVEELWRPSYDYYSKRVGQMQVEHDGKKAKLKQLF